MSDNDRKAFLGRNAELRRIKYNADSAYRKRILAKNREKRRANPRVIKGYELKKAYGITIEDFESMLEKQRGRCAICERPKPGGKGDWHVDHCHDTGRVRGLLCHFCNTAIGSLNDSVDLLKRCIKYLATSPR